MSDRARRTTVTRVSSSPTTSGTTQNVGRPIARHRLGFGTRPSSIFTSSWARPPSAEETSRTTPLPTSTGRSDPSEGVSTPERTRWSADEPGRHRLSRHIPVRQARMGEELLPPRRRGVRLLWRAKRARTARPPRGPGSDRDRERRLRRPGSCLQALDEGSAPVALEIGDGTNIAGTCVLSAVEHVRLGRGVLLARNVYIADHAHAFEDTTPGGARPGRRPSPPGRDLRRRVARRERRHLPRCPDRARGGRSAPTRSSATTCRTTRSPSARRRGSCASSAAWPSSSREARPLPRVPLPADRRRGRAALGEVRPRPARARLRPGRRHRPWVRGEPLDAGRPLARAGRRRGDDRPSAAHTAAALAGGVARAGRTLARPPGGRSSAGGNKGSRRRRERAPADLVYASMSPFESGAAAAADRGQARDPMGRRPPRPVGARRDAGLSEPLLHRRADRRRMCRVLRTAAAIVANTEEAAGRHRRHFPSLARTPVVPIPNGFDPAGLHRAGAVERTRRRVPDRPHRLSAHRARLRDGAARLVHGARSAAPTRASTSGRARTCILLEALERLLADDPPLAGRIELHLAGVLSDRRPRVVGGASIVKAHGYLAHDETVALMRSADLLFLPMHDLPDRDARHDRPREDVRVPRPRGGRSSPPFPRATPATSSTRRGTRSCAVLATYREWRSCSVRRSGASGPGRSSRPRMRAWSRATSAECLPASSPICSIAPSAARMTACRGMPVTVGV